MFEILMSEGISFDDCSRLLLESDPWLTLGYGKKEIQQISEASRSGSTWLAIDQGKIIGVAISHPKFLLGEYLKILAVEEKYRFRGVGRALMGAFEQKAFSLVPNTYLCVSGFNEYARKFYLGLGYQEIGVIQSLLLAGVDEVLMRKTIGPYMEWKHASY